MHISRSRWWSRITVCNGSNSRGTDVLDFGGGLRLLVDEEELGCSWSALSFPLHATSMQISSRIDRIDSHRRFISAFKRQLLSVLQNEFKRSAINQMSMKRRHSWYKYGYKMVLCGGFLRDISAILSKGRQCQVPSETMGPMLVSAPPSFPMDEAQPDLFRTAQDDGTTAIIDVL